ncbi:MAG: hypothetical protein IJ274_09605, partial [Lachnospiraceae bacterium]|nr:hypothetical protein [Lachnospiraceae bacterium]
TTAYDMALITRAFFADEVLTEIAGSVFYHINATPTQPDEIDLQNHHRMLVGCRYGSKYSYEYTLGGKTGYTDVARQTLVTCAQKDDMRLICVVLKDETPDHYLDTTNLMEYGFANFSQLGGKSYTGIPDGFEEEKAPEENASMEEESEPVNGGSIVIGTDEAQNLPDDTLNSEDEDNQGETNEEDTKGFSFVKILVTVVCVLAVAVCGFFLFIEYKKEQERKRRRAAIMERHRARKREDA